MKDVFQLRCEPIPLVRIALIGLGGRGLKTLRRYAFIRGAEIRLLADLDEERLMAANDELMRSGRPKAQLLSGEDGWKEACRHNDIDLIYICTDWHTHTPMAVEAMRQGKHVAVEVPAATTIEECHLLVETAEATRRHCFMTENCCYDRFALATLEIYRQGQLGRLTHLEGAYLHHLTDQRDEEGRPIEPSWMQRSLLRHGANPYPTHALGPIAHLIGLHRGDRMQYLVSMSNTHKDNDNLTPPLNTTLIHTAKGATIMLQLDVSTQRPYNRLQTVCGTKGFMQKYPQPTIYTPQTGDTLIGDKALAYARQFTSGHAAQLWEEGHAMGVPNEMNYAMDARLIHCLRHGLPLDIDVYDAAEWSSLSPLTALSAADGSRPTPIPDFTHGLWDTPEWQKNTDY